MMRQLTGSLVTCTARRAGPRRPAARSGAVAPRYGQAWRLRAQHGAQITHVP
jgi:hypothetical protein